VRKLPHDVHAILTGTGVPFGAGDPVNWTGHELIDFGFLLVAVAGLICAWRVVPFAYTAYTVAALAETLSYPTSLEPLQSLDRYLLVLFPLFMGFAARLARHRALTIGWLAVSGSLLAVFSGLWAHWAWVA
jgi:hypothetical protein